MSDSERLLELIENCIVEHGGDLGGWTHRGDGSLQLFDGRVTLAADLSPAGPAGREGLVHAHVLTKLHDYDDEALDACLFGIGEDGEAALRQCAVLWLTGVAGPIRSFLDNRPVCMTCQAGVAGGDASEGYSESHYGLPGLRAYVGPAFSRGLDDPQIQSAVDDQKPWFRFAAESAAPRRVHLAKSTVTSKGKEGWHRDLEIDGHDVAHHDPNWPAGMTGPDFGYVTRFAVFEFPRNSREIVRRAELERTIRHFAENYAKFESVDQLMQAMVEQGFDPDLTHEAKAISTIAFGRLLFEPHGVQFCPTVIRARQDGRVETDVPLMSIPAYSRARALAAQLRQTMPEDEFQALCLFSAESNAIMQAMKAATKKSDLSSLKMYPCVVPDRGISDQTMDAALAAMRALVEQNRTPEPKPVKKPWWKVW